MAGGEMKWVTSSLAVLMVLAAGAGGWLLLRGEEVADAVAAEQATAGDASGAQLRLLRHCIRRLQATEAKSGQPATRADASTEACLNRPGVIAAVRRELEATGTAGEIRALDGGVATDGAGPRALAQRFMRDIVGVDESEAGWLEQYMCAVHALRQQTMDDLDNAMRTGIAAEQLQELVQRAAAERREVLADVKQRLGQQRYEQLRALGGISLLSRTLDCEATEGAR